MIKQYKISKKRWDVHENEECRWHCIEARITPKEATSGILVSHVVVNHLHTVDLELNKKCRLECVYERREMCYLREECRTNEAAPSSNGRPWRHHGNLVTRWNTTWVVGVSASSARSPLGNLINAYHGRIFASAPDLHGTVTVAVTAAVWP